MRARLISCLMLAYSCAASLGGQPFERRWATERGELQPGQAALLDAAEACFARGDYYEAALAYAEAIDGDMILFNGKELHSLCESCVALIDAQRPLPPDLVMFAEDDGSALGALLWPLAYCLMAVQGEASLDRARASILEFVRDDEKPGVRALIEAADEARARGDAPLARAVRLLEGFASGALGYELEPGMAFDTLIAYQIAAAHVKTPTDARALVAALRSMRGAETALELARQEFGRWLMD